MTRIDEVRAIAEPIVAIHGFELYDLDQHGPTLRVTVTGVGGAQAPGIDDLGVITKEISRALDEVDPIGGRYTLEVSTPGLERKLRTPEHFRRAAGETVTVKVREPAQPARRVRGVVLGADDEAVTLRHDATSGAAEDSGADDSEARLAYDIIDSARTVFEWGMAPPDANSNPSAPDEGSTRRSNR